MANRLVYLVEKDPEIRANLGSQIGHYGYGVAQFAILSEAREAALLSAPGIIIISLTQPEGDMAMQLAEIESLIKPNPLVIFLSDSEDFSLRLRCVRLGGKAFFTKPVNMDALIGRIESLTAPIDRLEHRILIVESDPILAFELENALSMPGLSLELIADPLQTLDSIESFHPDLILANIYYPYVLGMELATMIRQLPENHNIPIVFHSTEVRSFKQIAALRRGGDDYVKRPVEPETLSAIVRAQLEKSRVQRAFLLQDSLTGLINHSALHESLQKKIERAGKDGPVTFALVDIDKFKTINDAYGHPVGDIVIKSLARILRQRVWSTDIIGRFSGEEFGIVITSMDAPTASRVFNEIRMDFAQIAHSWQGGEFYATFSCGLSAYPGYRDADALENASERAVSSVKQRGGNRVGLIGRSEGSRKP